MNSADASHKHSASDITDDITHRFVTDSEKTNWNGKAAGNHNHDSVYQAKGNYAAATHKHGASEINEDETHRFMTDAERTKLSGIAAGANNYTHPDTHPASMIEESTSRKFMTDAEKTLLSSLGTTYALADLSNATSKSFGSSSSYMKFNNGLLIQWGTKTGAIGFSSLYLPISFLDTNYSVQLTGVSSSKDEVIVYSPTVYITKTVSSFQFATRYIASGGEIAWTGWQFTWFAIDRWK